MWYDGIVGSVERLFSPLSRAVEKAVPDNTEKARILADLDRIKTQMTVEAMKVRLAVPWMRWVALGAGLLIGAMMVNNAFVVPYVPDVQPTIIPLELWAVFGASIGIEKLGGLKRAKDNNSPKG